MKEILEKIYNKEIVSFNFHQPYNLQIRQELFSGEIYEENLHLYEPEYKIEFKNEDIKFISLSDLIVQIFNYSTQLKQ